MTNGIQCVNDECWKITGIHSKLVDLVKLQIEATSRAGAWPYLLIKKMYSYRERPPLSKLYYSTFDLFLQRKNAAIYYSLFDLFHVAET